MSSWHGKRVTLMGLGRHGGGLGAAQWLAAQGARLTITDLAGEQAISESLARLAHLPIERYRLGEHLAEDFQQAEVLVVNPAVKPGHPLVEAARQRGAKITSEAELFLDACPAPVVGVTGSNGKSTTASMIFAILAAGGRRVWLGGNIGRSLLTELDQIRRDDWIVLELSSFQLHYLTPSARGVELAVITNCSANHLDWHGLLEDYVGSKQRLLAIQNSDGVAVLDPDDAEVSRWRPLVRGRLATPVEDQSLPELAVPGRHNRRNAQLAAAAAKGIGCSEAAIERGLKGFRGLPHRLEFVADIAGRRFYNDSKATTPEAAIAALDSFDSFDSPVWLLAGGHDKGGDYASLIAAAARRAQGVVFFGSAGQKLYALLRQSSSALPAANLETLSAALAWAWPQSRPGDVILLSPACASFDQFQDYAHRGQTFHALVADLGAHQRVEPSEALDRRFD